MHKYVNAQSELIIFSLYVLVKGMFLYLVFHLCISLDTGFLFFSSNIFLKLKMEIDLGRKLESFLLIEQILSGILGFFCREKIFFSSF